MVWGQSLPPFSGLQNEGVSCQFIPALVFYHCLIPSSGLFPRIHSKVSVTGPGVLNPGTTGLWGQMTLSSGCCPVRCRMFSSMPGSNPLDAITPPQVVTIKKLSPHMPGVLWGAKSSHVENHDTRPQDLGLKAEGRLSSRCRCLLSKVQEGILVPFYLNCFHLRLSKEEPFIVYTEYLTWIFHKATACLLALKVKTIVGTERVGGPLSADVEETFENTILSLCAPHPLSPFLALVNVSLYCL